MKLDFNLQVSQKQGIALTAQVQQAIKLLHMTNLEIQEFVTEQFQDNPFVVFYCLFVPTQNFLVFLFWLMVFGFLLGKLKFIE